ncbi:coiled-coil domain-containing protein [Gordonibacter urolithinfaciens]|uniref:coiled-coil domain-containing protein n=1 Tax=Gordonibacter urolithinfaciens TaxID=1335613 RepID=UPI003AAA7E71
MNPNAYPATNVPSAEPVRPQRRRPAAPFAARSVLGCLLAAFLACGLVPFAPRAAGADEVDEAAVAEAERSVEEAQSALDGAESSRQGIAADHEALVQEVAELQKRIDETTAQALEAQQEVIDGRAALAKAAVYEYRGGSAQSLVMLLLEAQSFDELVRNLVYLSSVVQYQVDEIEAQRERSARFDALMEDLNAQKDEQEGKLAELEEKKVQAEQTVSDASTRLQGAQSEYSSMLEELQRKIEEAEAQGSAPAEPVAVDESNTNTSRPGDQMTEIAPDPSPSPAPDGGSGSDPAPKPAPDPGVGWSTGVASAYGGSTDPSTPNPGITATGAVCDDWSMGVAVPMAWPRYWQYYGRTVEISYGGMTVLATVNDCGYMGGGSRSLDLQPGVWKAFGFSSCNDWGLRTVSYRFL